MPESVIVRENESAKSAYRRLEKLIELSRGRPSHKRRFGYYEKPSELKRKRQKFRSRQVGAGVRGGHVVLKVHPYSALYERTGPSNALMR